MSAGNGAGTPLRVIPLGGLGEIGLNFLVLEHGDTAIAVDCGVMFPDEQMPGIDVAIPDLTYVRGLGERFRAVFCSASGCCRSTGRRSRSASSASGCASTRSRRRSWRTAPRRAGSGRSWSSRSR
jgi:hypothetical protein